MITINKGPNDRILELGGGDNPNPASDVRVDVRSGPHTHFTADLEEPLPIKDEDFTAVFSQFCFEHVSWRKLPSLLAECFRVLVPGGKLLLVLPNSEAQVKWIADHENGWDGKSFFESASCVLFGDQDYPENTHKCWLTPVIMVELLKETGFDQINVHPYGERKTDMVVMAVKPQNTPKPTEEVEKMVQAVQPPITLTPMPATREEMFDKHYFNGGGKVGGYAGMGYQDFPVHHITFQHVMARKPDSVLEIGCARGPIIKRIWDAGIHAVGLEISKHCYMTRWADNIHQGDICSVNWESLVPGPKIDLCFSIAVMEHIPQEFIPSVIKGMAKVCERGLHGIDFGHKDDGFDKTHFSLMSKEAWEKLFAEHAPGWPVEIVDKEELERGQIDEKTLIGDGKVKLNIGSFVTCFHYGWTNIDVHDLSQWAMVNGYRYLRHDVRAGLPYGTGAVDLIYSSHFLEHLTYEEGERFLKECRRVLKPDTGAIRILVPDAQLLLEEYLTGDLNQFNEINDECDKTDEQARKLHSLLWGGDHKAIYDRRALVNLMLKCGLNSHEVEFRQTKLGEPGRQILKETLDMLPCLSLIVEAIPLV